MTRIKWTTDDIELLVQCNTDRTVSQLATMFQRPVGSIRTRLKLLNLTNTVHADGMTARLEPLYGDELTAFYWAGFILADGWVSQRNGYYRLGVSLSASDAEHLAKLAAFISVPLKFRTRDTNFKDRADSAEIEVTNTTSIKRFVTKFDIHMRKSHNPPDFRSYNFTDDQILALVLGFIDGDGTIITRKNGKSTQTMINLQLHQNWEPNLKWVSDTLQRILDIQIRSKVSINSRGHCVLALTKREMLAKLKRFSEVNHLPVMTRKWDKII